MNKFLLAVFMAAFLMLTNTLTIKADEAIPTPVYYSEEELAALIAQIALEVEAEMAANAYETQVTDYERSLLEKVAMNEAGNQGIQGMRYIVACILNRVESDNPDFEDTIEGVINQPNQFSNWDPNYISDECRQAVDEELKQRSNYNILWFSRGWPPYGQRLFEYGDHKFAGY